MLGQCVRDLEKDVRACSTGIRLFGPDTYNRQDRSSDRDNRDDPNKQRASRARRCPMSTYRQIRAVYDPNLHQTADCMHFAFPKRADLVRIEGLPSEVLDKSDARKNLQSHNQSSWRPIWMNIQSKMVRTSLVMRTR